MSWIVVAISAYMIMALSQLIDKALLKVPLKEVKAYVFLIGALSALVFVLLPFGIERLSGQDTIIALIGGALFIVALLPFLSALQGDDASRVIPLVGGTIPIATLLGEYFFLETELSRQDLFAFVLLVTGAVILTFTRSETGRRSWSSVIKAIIGSLLFAISFVITKYIFLQTDFISGFFWMRIGGVLVALILLFRKEVQNALQDFFSSTRLKHKLGYFGNQALNASGFVLQNLAISLASVSLVNALQGVQYIFVIIFVVITSRFKPGLLGEKITSRTLIEKITAVLILVAGIALLAL